MVPAADRRIKRGHCVVSCPAAARRRREAPPMMPDPFSTLVNAFSFAGLVWRRGCLGIFCVRRLRVKISPRYSLSPTRSKVPMVAMSFLPGCPSPRPPRSRWRSRGRRRSATHASGPERSAGWQGSDFLVSARNGRSPGEESRSATIAARRSRRSRPCGQIASSMRPRRRVPAACRESHVAVDHARAGGAEREIGKPRARKGSSHSRAVSSRKMQSNAVRFDDIGGLYRIATRTARSPDGRYGRTSPNRR
jgi:hypothetical protein